MRPWLTPPTGEAAALTARFAAIVPVLETARLRLRAPTIADFAAYEEIYHSDRWPGDGEAGSDEDAWLDYNQMLASWMLRGIGLFAVETNDGTLIGFASIDHEWGDPEVEIGWMLTAAAEGQGFATEAGAALMRFATSQGRTSVVSYMGKNHPRSAAVSERLGGVRDPKAEAALNNDTYVYRHYLEDRP
ncbi:GNAT family N-acetyltransferase [Cognatiyoonia sp. IB215446]|uniref:GNAT family N-acetyltransferase n=1 Tax=Cognatiyoonia sp. IB215446 TaxID=3097355 RepID=UPI002A0B7A05|nr:GNAT family N-acetyltransferase [Cognatiyoonia sp. IB215446]MDX8347119.1 GNAT family N-acetyltransferase [Cognatiyoonia sp. IB215446]